MIEFTTSQSFDINYWLMPIVVKKIITADHVINASCKAFDINKEELMSCCRKKHLVNARFICMYIMRMRLRLTLKQIGAEFGRDHTTAIHAIGIINDELSVPAYRHQLNEKINKVIELL